MTIESKSAGGIVINKDGKVLVVNQRGTSWSLPKGHIDENESALETAKREIYEESGIKDLEYIEDLGEYQRYKIALAGEDGKTELKNITMFLFKTSEEDLKPIDTLNPEARWVEKDKVVDLLTHPKDKEFFKKNINKIK